VKAKKHGNCTSNYVKRNTAMLKQYHMHPRIYLVERRLAIKTSLSRLSLHLPLPGKSTQLYGHSLTRCLVERRRKRR
jgi:hypothetical protein